MSLVTDFLLDTHALTTGVSFVPSAQLTDRVRTHESTSGKELKGILHSHPGAMNWLSGPDHHAVERGLAVNPHLGSYLCPIATINDGYDGKHDAAALADNEIQIAGGRITFFVGGRKRSGGIGITETTAVVLPIHRDSEAVAAHLGAESVANLGIVEIEGRSLFARQIRLSGGVDLTLLYGVDYPVAPPIAILGVGDGNTKQLSLAWPLDLLPEQRLRAAIDPHFHRSSAKGGRYRRAWGPTSSQPLTENAEVAAVANWAPVITDMDVVARSATVRDEALARTRGLLPAVMGQRKVLIAGSGTVGSYLAEQLARSGIGSFELLDPDVVGLANLSRTCYRLADIGAKKVDAIARLLININPLVQVKPRAVTIQDLGVEGLDEAVQAADLVLNAADDPQAAHALSRFAYSRGKPFVSVGLFAGAQGGEVVISVPGRTPCFGCATNFRRAMEQDAGRVSTHTDYGTGRLQGEVALGSDVHHVASAAAKLVLSLLMPADSTGVLHDLAEKALAAHTPYLLMGMVPSYWFFPAVFRDTPGQHAYQAVWAGVESSDDCPVCGQNRVDPASVPLRAPSAAEFRKALANAVSVEAGYGRGDSRLISVSPDLASKNDDLSSLSQQVTNVGDRSVEPGIATNEQPARK